MPYPHSYLGMSFRDFLHAEEERERHLLHEVGHLWFGEICDATLGDFNLNPGGVSNITLNGTLTLEQHYRVGVAGLLAEAKGIVPGWRGEPRLDVERMGVLAHKLFTEVTAHQHDQDHGFLVEVPLTTRIPSRETAGCSITDFTQPIENGLSEEMIRVALEHVAGVFNTPRRWAEFQVRVEQLRP